MPHIKILASEMANIEIWKGNRPFSNDRMNAILNSLHSIEGLARDKYYVAIFNQKPYIVNGQHRAAVLKKHFLKPNAKDFYLDVVEEECETEEDVQKFLIKANRNLFYD